MSLGCKQVTPVQRGSLAGRTLRLAVPAAIRRPAPIRRRHLAPECRRGFDDRNRRRGPGDDKYVRFKLYRKEFSVPEDQLWRLILPAAGVLGLAAFLGPLVIGLSVAAVALGAAFSAGALAFAAMLPLFIFLGLGGLFIGPLVLGPLFIGFALPQLIGSVFTLGILGGATMLGWGAVNWLLGLQQNNAPSSSSSGSTKSWDKIPTGYKSTIFGAYSTERDELMSEEEAEEREQAARTQQELKQFDEILARKEWQQRQQKQKERYYDRDIEIK